VKVPSARGRGGGAGDSRDGKSPTTRKYARERPVDGKLEKFAKPYAQPLEFDFSSFAKKTKDSKWF